MNIQTLRAFSTTRPKVVLDWAKRFTFIPEVEQPGIHYDRSETYSEEALIAFQAISRAVVHTPKQIVEWLVEMWERYCRNERRHIYIFGNNPSIEFDYVDDWIKALFKGLIDSKPHLFGNLVEPKIAHGSTDLLVIEYLKALSAKKPTRAFDLMIQVWGEHSIYTYGAHRSIEWVVYSFLTHVYEQNPDRVLRFVEQKAKRLPDTKQFSEIVDKVIGIK